jgi:acyl-CoA reductase-like NAD-dependent aldehyde dehydrogenase
MVIRATQCRVRLANNSEYGLVAYVFTRDLNRGIRMGDRLETGMLGLNAGVISNAAAPFGGVKQSGLSSEAASKASRSTSTPNTLAPPTRTRARRNQPLSPPTENHGGRHHGHLITKE